MNSTENTWQRKTLLLFTRFLFCLFLATVLYLTLYTAANDMTLPSLTEIRASFAEHTKYYTLLLFLIALPLFGISLIPKSFWNFIYRFRYFIALLTFVCCVIFGVNGSSAGIWRYVLKGEADTGVLFGLSRGIRSDEWMLFTPSPSPST